MNNNNSDGLFRVSQIWAKRVAQHVIKRLAK